MRVAVTTLGCKVNQYDAASIETRLRDEGCTIVPFGTEAQFEETLRLLEALPFTYFHVFPYSRRGATTAAKLDGQLPPVVIKRRAQALRQLGQRKRAEFARGFIGREAQVLVEENPAAAAGYVTGYSRNYQPVEFAGDAEMVNREVEVRIVGWRRDKPVGQMLVAAPA